MWQIFCRGCVQIRRERGVRGKTSRQRAGPRARVWGRRLAGDRARELPDRSASTRTRSEVAGPDPGASGLSPGSRRCIHHTVPQVAGRCRLCCCGYVFRRDCRSHNRSGTWLSMNPKVGCRRARVTNHELPKGFRMPPRRNLVAPLAPPRESRRACLRAGLGILGQNPAAVVQLWGNATGARRPSFFVAPRDCV